MKAKQSNTATEGPKKPKGAYHFYFAHYGPEVKVGRDVSPPYPHKEIWRDRDRDRKRQYLWYARAYPRPVPMQAQHPELSKDEVMAKVKAEWDALGEEEKKPFEEKVRVPRRVSCSSSGMGYPRSPVSLGSARATQLRLCATVPLWDRRSKIKLATPKSYVRYVEWPLSLVFVVCFKGWKWRWICFRLNCLQNLVLYPG